MFSEFYCKWILPTNNSSKAAMSELEAGQAMKSSYFKSGAHGWHDMQLRSFCTPNDTYNLKLPQQPIGSVEKSIPRNALAIQRTFSHRIERHDCPEASLLQLYEIYRNSTKEENVKGDASLSLEEKVAPLHKKTNWGNREGLTTPIVNCPSIIASRNTRQKLYRPFKNTTNCCSAGKDIDSHDRNMPNFPVARAFSSFLLASNPSCAFINANVNAPKTTAALPRAMLIAPGVHCKSSANVTRCQHEKTLTDKEYKPFTKSTLNAHKVTVSKDPSEEKSMSGVADRGLVMMGAHVIKQDNKMQFLLNIPKNEIIPNTDYSEIKQINKGSFGIIFFANWKGKCVAIKRAHGKMTLEAMRSVAREINSYRKLLHPHIVEYYGVCFNSTCIGIVTEYLSGGNLFDALYYGNTYFSTKTRIKLALQLTRVVDYLHNKKNLIHRDLKTANLILDENQNLKLCDFGKARELDASRRVKLDDNGGSPRYMAPECFYLGNSINEKADIWSVACCLIEIFGGPVPFQDIRTNKVRNRSSLAIATLPANMVPNSEVVHALLVKKRIPTVPIWFPSHLKAILSRCFSWKLEQRATTEQIEAEITKMAELDLELHKLNKT
ncbi:Tyrosine kinase-like (TKL) protein [Cardiosporidium cionae]|uniref:Tyrosine kinase-like (TKL) protein n=1 Tax=Cardiosporidium cionae TaxID=476202 RepID=A0ABQ7JC33_9APIC|nr:Tyrosine kinase-like (TKL) protein [Cardiosporidium cionae]|eukprot:KAF8821588.1 Tyrosine kinase-like (TKL) protein [Cardiosporidium cionae]